MKLSIMNTRDPFIGKVLFPANCNSSDVMIRICCFFMFTVLFIGCEDMRTENIPSDIAIGQPNQNMIIQEIDTIIQLFNTDLTIGIFEFKIDIDRDGVNDIKFSHSFSWSKWGVDEDLTQLKVINTSFNVAGSYKPDTIFVCGYVDSLADPHKLTYDSTFYSKSTNYICNYSVDIHSVTEHLYPDVQLLSDTLKKETHWIGEGMQVRLINILDTKLLCIEDTYIYWWRRKLLEGLIDRSSAKYIVLRKLIGDEIRYGWIEYSITKDLRVQIHTTAFEKDN